jgi:transcriptional regulator with XRE-family HTH domain
MPAAPPTVGSLLRDWRRRRRLSQLDLAGDVETSTRHLSFIETGRARPSREMLLRLAAALSMPLRARNALLLAGGFAPSFPERSFGDPSMSAVRGALDAVLAGHEPYPALAIDRRWTLVAANRAVAPLLATAAPELLAPPVNVLRLTLHPDGIAPRIVNLGEWRAHLFDRVRRQLEAAPDEELAQLLDELHRGAGRPARVDPTPLDGNDLLVPLRLRCKYGELRFYSTTMVFGAPGEVTVSELAVESFFPADSETIEHLRTIAAAVAEREAAAAIA